MSFLGSIGSFLTKAAPVASAFAPYVGAGASFLGGQMQNAASAKAASRQMAFQADMSGTAHQREVEDLKKAGLNPILSATGGSGASSPGGSSFQPVNSVENTVSSARQGMLLKAQLDNIKADTVSKLASAGAQNVPLAAFNRDHPELAKWLAGISQIFGSAGDATHAASSAKSLLVKKPPGIVIHK